MSISKSAGEGVYYSAEFSSSQHRYHDVDVNHDVDVVDAVEMKLHMNSGHPITFIVQRPLFQGDNVSRHTVVDSLAAFYIFHHSSQPPQ